MTEQQAVRQFIERIEKRVGRWQTEGLSAQVALNQAWANELLDMEAEGVLPKGYFRCRVGEHEGEMQTRSEQH